MIWMLSASSARRWSSWRLVDGGSEVATVDIGETKKARWTSSPGLGLPSCSIVSGFYPNSRTVAAGTRRVLVQQHEQRQLKDMTVKFYLRAKGLPRMAGPRRPGK